MIKVAGAVTAGATLAAFHARGAGRRRDPRVTVVRGRAGRRPHRPYEGSTRSGGRCCSLHGSFGDVTADQHRRPAIRTLASCLGPWLDAMYGGSCHGWVDRYRLGGAGHPFEPANADPARSGSR